MMRAEVNYVFSPYYIGRPPRFTDRGLEAIGYPTSAPSVRDETVKQLGVTLIFTNPQ